MSVNMDKKLYCFIGAVRNFDKIVCNEWRAQTYAVSAKQALSNMAYQFKKQNGYAPSTKITLDGKLR